VFIFNCTASIIETKCEDDPEKLEIWNFVVDGNFMFYVPKHCHHIRIDTLR
jgi:hypothetical protein